ncbi:MAG: tetratricopeptide repeat protein [Gemmatimonadetes bacterium]|nr:tetratricopeptide repeat protein [Gemmatimonadota bacterium]
MTSKQIAGLLVAAVILTYGNSLGGAFHYDDFHSLVNNTSIRDVETIPSFFTQTRHFSADADKSMYRPIVLTSYAFDYAIHGNKAVGFHVTNVLLHLVCVLLFWRVVVCVEGISDWRIGALAAVMFAVHPVGSEPVNYVSSRSESLAAMFMLLALWLGLRHQPRLLGSFGSFAASLLSKATGAALPMLLLAWPGGTVTTRLRRVLPYMVLLVGYMAILAFAELLPTSRAVPVRDTWAQLATQWKAVAYYLQLLLMPVHQSVDPAFNEGVWSQGAVWAAMIFAISLVVLVLRCRGKLTWWLLWPLLVALPASAVPLNVLVNEHRIYLAGAGLFAAFAALVMRQPRLQRPILLLFVCLIALTIQRNQVWATEQTLWSDAVRLAPFSSRGRVHLGKALRDDGQLLAAQVQFEQAISLDQSLLSARANLASIYYEQAIEATPINGELLDRARRQYESVLEYDGAHREALVMLGNVYQKANDNRGAIAMYERAIAAHPNYADAYVNLAQLYFDAGRFAAAIPLMFEVTRLEPSNGRAFYDLGNTYFRAALFPQAAAAYRQACQLDPTDSSSCYNLGEVLFALSQQSSSSSIQYATEARRVFNELKTRHGTYRLVNQRLEQLDAGGR